MDPLFGHLRLLAVQAYPQWSTCSHGAFRLFRSTFHSHPNQLRTYSYNMADPKFLQYIDEHQEELIDRLAAAVAIPS